jgi:cation diffusion facilitator family transporter
MSGEHAHIEITRRKTRAARVSIYSNTSLTLLKLVAGFLSGSVSVLSEAIHSASDLLASWLAFFAVRVSDRPADHDHPYGHGKAESLSGLAEALLIFGAAAYIIYESIARLVQRSAPHSPDIGIAVMAVSAVVNTIVAAYLFRVARKTDSLALLADAEHLRTDVLTSLGVLVGLVMVSVTGWGALDPLVAIVVALIIVRAAWVLTHSAMAPLMDRHLPQDDLDAVREILDSEECVRDYHKLRSRKSGSHRYIDAHVLMDDHLSLLEAHDLTEKVEDRIRQRLPNTEITLHTEPYHNETLHQYEKHSGPLPPGKTAADGKS